MNFLDSNGPFCFESIDKGGVYENGRGKPVTVTDGESHPPARDGELEEKSGSRSEAAQTENGDLAGFEHPAPPLSETQYAEAAARRLMLVQAAPLFDSGLADARIARLIGVSPAVFSRVVNLCACKSTAALTTKGKVLRLLDLPMARLAPPPPKYRGSEFEPLLQVKAVTDEIIRLYVATMGASCDKSTNDRRTGSIATTLKRLGDFEVIPPGLAAKLQAGSQPKPLVDFIKKTFTPEIEAKIRGQKHYQHATVCGRRDLVEEFADGSIGPLRPGRVWVFDDMSSNIPFWFEVDRECAETVTDKGLRQLVERHGCVLGRQGLYAWDWATGAWLGMELVGRLRDAYQSADILRFVRKLVTLYGKPEKIIFERGVWMSRSINGWSVMDDDRLVEREDALQIPDMDSKEKAKITDGIRAIGVEIIYAYSSRGKPIEGAFNYHQRLVPTFFERGEVVNIGRHAGEFEWSAKAHLRASKGVLHPRDLGFVHIDRHADVSWQAMMWEGNKPKARRDGPPIPTLAAYLSASPLQPVTHQDLAAFLPHKDSITIRGGLISPLGHQFINPEQFAAMGDSTRVFYAFDPAEPTLGAAIYTAKGFLCWADYQPAGPVISARDRSQEAGPQNIRRYKAAHRNAFRALDIATLRPVAVAERRDGSGGATLLQHGGGATAKEVHMSPAHRVRHTFLDPKTPEEFSRQRTRLAASAARARELLDLVEN